MSTRSSRLETFGSTGALEHVATGPQPIELVVETGVTVTRHGLDYFAESLF